MQSFIDRYSQDGIIWYMETFDMDEERIRAMFEGMSKNGWFKGVSGFVFGRPLFYKGKDYKEVILQSLKDYDVPKVFDADVGHKAPRMTFINGAKARFTVSGAKGRIEYDLEE
jgi:muramoyltetrapeptide carboxypeptidase LdcA involved in peptidoglycan recycling